MTVILTGRKKEEKNPKNCKVNLSIQNLRYFYLKHRILSLLIGAKNFGSGLFFAFRKWGHGISNIEFRKSGKYFEDEKK